MDPVLVSSWFPLNQLAIIAKITPSDLSVFHPLQALGGRMFIN
jgi:hypothetical protein